MRSFRKIARGALVAVLLVASAGLGGCQLLSDAEGLYSSVTNGSAAQSNTMAQAEIAYTTVVGVATIWVSSGKCTPAQAVVVKSFDNAAYAAIVSGRTAAAANDSAALALAMSLINTANANLSNYVQSNGGASGS